jgi:hypothetical protein
MGGPSNGHKGSLGAPQLTLSEKDVKGIQEAAISGTFLRKAVGTTEAPSPLSLPTGQCPSPS